MKTQPKAYGALNKGWVGKQFALLAFLLSALTALPAYAVEPSKQKLVYEVYAGGFHAVQAHVEIELTAKNRYNITVDAKTRGLLGRLAPWSGTFETHGRALGNDRRYPVQHKSVGYWRKEVDVKDYSYNGKGRFNKITIDEHDKDPYVPTLDKAITDGTVDALSAALLVFEDYNKTGECSGESKVFDGKRSYLQTFVHDEISQLKSSRYNIYSGEAAECTVEVTPLKGRWYSKPRGWLSIQEQGRSRGLLPRLWLASINEDAPAVPVKIRVKTDYGTLFMHLAEYQNGEDIKVAKKRHRDDKRD